MKLTDLYKSALHSIAEKRTGGQIAIEGFFFQFQYSLWNLLESLSDDKIQGVRLEGIEDLDVFEHYEEKKVVRKFYQIKHSKNSLSPSQFWNKGIIQNFIEVFLKDRNARFVVVHDMEMKGDYLTQLVNGSLDEKGLEYWQKRIIEFQRQQEKGTPQEWNTNVLQRFFLRISFQKISENQLQKQSLSQIIKLFNINTGNVDLFYKSLLQKTLEWSLDREFVTFQNLQNEVKKIQSEIEKGGVNNAVKQGWINEVEFIPVDKSTLSKYYEGVSARPTHIASGLPVRRKTWEKEVEANLIQSDIAVIKASSGQGKSTIGWQTAFNLKQNGHTIYELTLCDLPEKIGELCSFFETRYKYLGEYPVIIVDGLNQLQKSWNLLAIRLADAPIKFIVTTREEDWKIFGTGFSNLDIRFINLKMSFNEARDIFNILKKNGVIHQAAPKWQTAWESVKSKGLMIEYIFLITQGRMLHTRLEEQITNLNNPKLSTDSPAKIEILRLVSLADLCGIKLKTEDVIYLVKETVGITTDRGNLIESLESEYYLKFGTKYIEGLHSVRSGHLFELLHRYVSPKETAINLVPLITKNQIQLFFSNILSFLDSEDYEQFINFCGKFFSSKPYLQMSAVCDGLFQFEVKSHWKNNKEHYDKIYEYGGIQLCPIDTAPWMEKRFVENMSATLEGRLSHLTEEISKVQKFDPQKNVVSAFLTTLQNEELRTQIKGLGSLSQWYLKFKIPYKVYDNFQFDKIIKLISEGEIEEATSIADSLYVYNQDSYISFVQSKKAKVFSELKKQTQTLSIEEEGKDVKIEYLLTENNITNGNEESVKRIDVIRSIMPTYERYCTQGIVPPLELYEYLNWDLIDGSVKRMPKENVYDKFQIHLNQMWVNGIQSFYSCESLYEWQEQWIKIRKLGLNFIMDLNRLIEAYLEGKKARINKLAKSIEGCSEKVIQLIRTERKISELDESEFGGKIKKVEKELASWTSKLHNVISQTLNLFDKVDTQKRHVANVNVIGTFRGLNEMQAAFNSVAHYPTKYFDTNELEEKESYWYARLFNSVQYLVEHLDEARKINNAKNHIASWINANELSFNESIKSALSFLEQTAGFQTIQPNFALHGKLLTTVVIGIRGVELTEIENEFIWLCIGLQGFADVKLDFLTVVFVRENTAIGAWRFSKETLSQLKEMIENDSFDESTFKKPLPFNLDEETISPLQGIQLNQVAPDLTESHVYQLFEALWKLAKYRERLDAGSEIEMNWLKEIETECREKAQINLAIIEKECPAKVFQKYSNLAAQIIDEGKPLSNQEFTDYTSELFKQALKKI